MYNGACACDIRGIKTVTKNAMKRIILPLSLMAFCVTMNLSGFAQSAGDKYAALKNKLAYGWNIWNTRSVLSHVLLPEALAINLELKDGSSGKTLTEALIGRRGEGVELIRPGIHSYDGSYTELAIEWQGIKLKIESAGTGRVLVILITPQHSDADDYLLVRPIMLWNKKGTITKVGGSLIATLPSGNLTLHSNTTVSNTLYTDSLLSLSSLQKKIGVSVGKKRSVAEIESTVAQARTQLLKQYKKYPDLAEMHQAMQNVLAWDVIYEPTHGRVIAPVSRIWSTNAAGWVIFDWDTYFAAWMFALENKELAYANAIAITDEITASGFIPNYAAGIGKTDDRSQPPVGSIVIRELYRKYKDKWLLQYVFDKLLSWNRWWPQKRDVRGYLVWGSDLLKTEAPKWESGLDNSTMYDNAPYDSTSKLQMLADVGLMSTYIADCKALADIATTLNKADIAAELLQRAQKYTASLHTLWSDEVGLFLNKRLDNDSFSHRLSPTLFYPLIAGVATQGQAERMIKEHFYNPAEFWGEWILPSSARNDPHYKDNTYWRGRIWAPMNFLVYLGIRNYSLPQARKDLIKKSEKLLLKSWIKDRYIYENYNADKGEGDDVANSDKFYHWGALLGFISFIEKGYLLPPLKPLK